jgi:hypothetical protein
MGNRKFVYIPQINPNTFLFFYHEGSSGKSFSFRDYPAQGKPKTTYAKAYPSFSADQILKLAKHVFDAPTHPTTDNEYWYSKIKELNERYLSHEKPSADTAFNRISIPIKPVPKNGHETAFCIKGQGDQVISSVNDWHLYAPPKNPVIQWQDGKSAKELARAWFRGGKLDMPKDLRWLLKSHSVTSNFEPYEGFAEHKTPLDNFGEPRNHDLVIIGNSDKQKILIGVEAKETEKFDEPIAQKKSDNPRSNIENRKQLLSEQLFGRSIDKDIGLVRYQLITGTAGTLIEAKNQNSKYAVFIIHEFLTSKSDVFKSEANSFEIDRFVKAITKNEVTSLKSGKLIDIGCLPGGQFVPNNIPLLIGKVTTQLN